MSDTLLMEIHKQAKVVYPLEEDALRRAIFREGALWMQSRLEASPPQCRHVVKDTLECDHGMKLPYTSICADCGPDFGCEHAGIRGHLAGDAR